LKEVRPGGYVPEEHVKDMDLDGIDVSIVYPSLANALYIYVPDRELLSSIFRTYNDWVGEFCRAAPKRLKGIAQLNVDDVQEGIKELERCATMGFVGAVIPVYPPGERTYDQPEYEPLWAAAQDLAIPLSLHVGTNRLGAGDEHDHVFQKLMATATYKANKDYWVRMSLGSIILSGVFERYPKLQVGSVEHDLSWAPYFLDRLDYNYTQRIQGVSDYRFKDDALPSDFFHRNVFLGFQEDGLSIQMRHRIGVENLQWGGDYPHAESTFPRSQEILEEILVDCTEEEKAKISGGNAARIYNLN
jgi:predicted TIM-barrel fold metal-dependent hydrolase